jgi:NADPH:quinone reductase-like Zn-dependent oxidoreductase
VEVAKELAVKKFVFSTKPSLDDLNLVDAPEPVPGPGMVQVRIRAVSLNRSDLLILSGLPNTGSFIPGLSPLIDAAGEVTALGPGVSHVNIGDRVMPNIIRDWYSGDFQETYRPPRAGWQDDGVLAEYACFPESSLVKIPDHLSFEEAAALPCAALTAWNALFDDYQPLVLGESVLVLGTGGVSIFALQFAVLAGAQVIVTSSSDTKLSRVQALGAHATINYRSQPDWASEIRRLTDGHGVDRVVETVGASTLEASARAVRIGGAIQLVGVQGRGMIDPEILRATRGSIRSIAIGSRDQFIAMCRAISLHKLRPIIDRVFDFKEARAAYLHLRDQGPVGKVIIKIG